HRAQGMLRVSDFHVHRTTGSIQHTVHVKRVLQMNIQNVKSIIGMLAFATLMLASTIVHAQTAGDNQWASWWYGGFLGGNINLFSGELHDLNADGVNDAGVANPTGFDKGTGFGLAL